MCYSMKHKDKYNERKARVERLNARHAWLTMLDGPAKGEKRKAEYHTIKVWPRELQVKKTVRLWRLLLRVYVLRVYDSGQPSLA